MQVRAGEFKTGEFAVSSSDQERPVGGSGPKDGTPHGCGRQSENITRQAELPRQGVAACWVVHGGWPRMWAGEK